MPSINTHKQFWIHVFSARATNLLSLPDFYAYFLAFLKNALKAHTNYSIKKSMPQRNTNAQKRGNVVYDRGLYSYTPTTAGCC